MVPDTCVDDGHDDGEVHVLSHDLVAGPGEERVDDVHGDGDDLLDEQLVVPGQTDQDQTDRPGSTSPLLSLSKVIGKNYSLTKLTCTIFSSSGRRRTSRQSCWHNQVCMSGSVAREERKEMMRDIIGMSSVL